MPSYLKNYTKGQATRAIRVGQDGFLAGLNLDLPRNEVEATSLLECNNYIPFRTHLEGRAGTRLFGSAPVGVTIFHSMDRHPDGKFIGHWDDKLYISDDANTWVQSTGTWNPADADSKLQWHGRDVLLFQSDRILTLEIRDSENYLRRFNSPNPTTKPPVTGSTDSDGGAFIYRFIYTYARYIDDVLLAETGCFTGDKYKDYYTELKLTEPLDDNDTVFMDGLVMPTDSEDGTTTQWTHINIYRTQDLGINKESQKAQYYLAKSQPIFENAEVAGIGLMIVEGVPVFQVAVETGTLSISDDTLISNLLFNKLFYIALPSSLLGSVSDGIIFCQDGLEPRINFSFTGILERSGYYFEGSQKNVIHSRLVDLVPVGGHTAVICEDRTYLASEASFESGDQVLGADIGVVYFNLHPFEEIDVNIGVRDRGTISRISQSQFISVCNDGAVRIFDKTWLPSDKASKTVSMETKAISSGSSSIFHPEGYYLLTYSKDTGETVCNNTLRRGLVEDVGTGWSRYSGDGWMKPVKTQSYMKTVYNGNLMLLCVDSDNNIYWVDSYDGPTGSGLTREKLDRVGGATEYAFDLISEHPPIKGAKDSYSVRHLNTFITMAPYYRGEPIDSASSVSLEIFKDDDNASYDVYNKVLNQKDVIFHKDLIAHSLRLRVTSNDNSISITKYETILEVLDTPNSNRDNDESLKLQETFANDLSLSMGRSSTIQNNVKTLASGDKFSIDVGVTTTITGPDGELNTGVSF